MSCFIWAAIVGLIIIISMMNSGENGSRWRACGIFLLVKGHILSFGTLMNALHIPARDNAMVGAYFFSLMTLVIAVVVVMVHMALVCVRTRHIDSGSGADDGVANTDVDDDTPAETQRAGYRRLITEEDDVDDGANLLSRTAIKMGAFGAPNLFVWI